MKKTPIILRLIFFICLIIIFNIILFLIYKTAPIESLNYLKENPIWNYLIIGISNISLIIGKAAIVFPELKQGKRNEK